ncbi:MAG TPA: alpha/beta fold hydrolase [Gemmatimonadaceae bacterium]|nr:alpha/beta fold hydrolase [Gemmatimonadaceae bacterium]
MPVVLLHGFPHNRSLWAPQTSALLEHGRCIAPDLRGFGESGREGPYSMEQFAEDVIELLASLGIDKAVIGGLSMGGYVALALWRAKPELVRALVLADTRPGADSPETRRKRLELIAVAREGGASAVANAQINGMVGATTRAQNPALVDGLHQMLASAPVEGIIGALQAMMDRPDSTDLLPSINVPTLVIVGQEDALTPVKESREMHAAIPGSRLEILPGAGHVSNLEKPAAFNHVLTEFLSSLHYA